MNSMKSLLSILLVLCLVAVPACDVGVSLELGTIGVKANLAVDEWAQANVLKSLDELVSAGVDKLKNPDNPESDETEVVQPQ